MKTTDAFTGLECIDCGAAVDASESHRCPDCGGALESTYDYDAIDLDRETLADRPFDSQWRYAELLPFARESAVTTAEGATPLVDCPDLADELGVGRVLIKDDGRNPTGSSTDRGASVAVTAAVHHGASDVALPSTGNGGQAVAAYAGRAGLDSHAYLPSRSGFTNKAMVNVHGGDMNVVGGRFGDAAGAFEEALDEHDDWYSLRSFDTPYRHEGAKTLFYEIAEQLEWDVPDAICYPTGAGVGIVGLATAAREFRELGLIDDLPGSLRRPGVRLCADRRGVRRRPRRARAGRTPRHDLWRTRDSRSRGESANPRGAPRERRRCSRDGGPGHPRGCRPGGPDDGARTHPERGGGRERRVGARGTRRVRRRRNGRHRQHGIREQGGRRVAQPPDESRCLPVDPSSHYNLERTLVQ